MMLSQFDVLDEDGVVTFEEFSEYYRDLSASMKNDQDFELMMRNSYHITGGAGKAVNSTNMRALVTFKDGRKEMIMIENDLHLSKYDHAAVMKRLEEQGMSTATSDQHTSTNPPTRELILNSFKHSLLLNGNIHYTTPPNALTCSSILPAWFVQARPVFTMLTWAEVDGTENLRPTKGLGAVCWAS